MEFLLDQIFHCKWKVLFMISFLLHGFDFTPDLLNLLFHFQYHIFNFWFDSATLQSPSLISIHGCRLVLIESIDFLLQHSKQLIWRLVYVICVRTTLSQLFRELLLEWQRKQILLLRLIVRLIVIFLNFIVGRFNLEQVLPDILFFLFLLEVILSIDQECVNIIFHFHCFLVIASSIGWWVLVINEWFEYLVLAALLLFLNL